MKKAGAMASSHGCFNRAPFKPEQVLYGINSQTGEPIKTVIPFRMTTQCVYQKFDLYNDPGCVGCKHKEERCKTSE